MGKLPGTLTLLLALFSQGLAADTYVGVGNHFTAVEWDALTLRESLGSNRDDTDSGLKALVGVTLSEHLAIEAFYSDLGEASAAGSGGAASFEADTFGVAALIAAPVNPQTRLYAKLGYHQWDATVSPRQSLASDGGDLLLGLGGSYLTNGVELRLEYERYTLDQADIDALGFSVAVHF